MRVAAKWAGLPFRWFTTEVAEMLERDMKTSRLIDPSTLKNRSWFWRFSVNFARVVGASAVASGCPKIVLMRVFSVWRIAADP